MSELRICHHCGRSLEVGGQAWHKPSGQGHYCSKGCLEQNLSWFDRFYLGLCAIEGESMNQGGWREVKNGAPESGKWLLIFDGHYPQIARYMRSSLLERPLGIGKRRAHVCDVRYS